MVPQRLFRLYPPPHDHVDLCGLYLSLRLHERGTPDHPYVFANFLTSLDGRIALADESGLFHLPKSLTTPHDFRLFLELKSQADCLITHGGYLRALARGQLGNILQNGEHPLSGDLVEWRRQQGLPAQPSIVIASASLDFPMPPSIREYEQRCYIATGEQADPERVAAWRARGYEVIFAGKGLMVEGEALTRALGALGYSSLYLIAGPQMLDTMVREGCLSSLFQTMTHQLMGGESFHTMVPGPVLGPFGHLKMRSLYYDDSAPSGAGQWFIGFDCQGKTGSTIARGAT